MTYYEILEIIANELGGKCQSITVRIETMLGENQYVYLENGYMEKDYAKIILDIYEAFKPIVNNYSFGESLLNLLNKFRTAYAAGSKRDVQGFRTKYLDCENSNFYLYNIRKKLLEIPGVALEMVAAGEQEEIVCASVKENVGRVIEEILNTLEQDVIALFEGKEIKMYANDKSDKG